MGIKNLNKFIVNECPSSIKKISLSELSGKKIVVDISIYIFKYAMDGGLMDNMYILCSLFKNYNIIPVFIFDGKSPNEKKKLLEQRREDRNKLKREYEELKTLLQSDTNSENETFNIRNDLDVLNKKLVVIKKEDFENVKKLIIAFGFMYFDAEGEADELCAYLCLKGIVWGCLSEDMDMFVYGCQNIVRCLNLLNTSAVVYDNTKILNDLRLTQKELREICVLSGTDYNTETEHQSINLFNTLKLFKKYKKKCPKLDKTVDFYEWLLLNNTDYIKDYDLLVRINNMFSLKDQSQLKSFEKCTIRNGAVNENDLKLLLMRQGFIFP